MKKACLFLAILIVCLNSLTIAQPTLFGLTPFGGVGSGAIVKFDIGTKSLTADYSFPIGDGRPPVFEFSEAPNGKFYNVVRDGGAANLGRVISYDPVTHAVSTVAEFTAAIGVSPDGALTLGSNGKFYGMTVNGGLNQYGLMYSFDPGSNTLEKVMDFYGTEVRSPYFSLLRARDGKLYGVGPAVEGGRYAVFTFDVSTNTITRIPFADNNSGYNANGNLAEGIDGKLYIVTGNGNNGFGALYSYMPGSFGFNKILDFDSRVGDYPMIYLMGASNGSIYGTSNMGGVNYAGCIFSFHPAVQSINYLFDFGLPGGTYPRGGMVEAGNGQLVGSALGGVNGAGIIYTLDPVSNQVVTAINFNGANGSTPNLGLLNSSEGKIFGTANEGGKSNIGLIYSFDPVTSSINTEFQYLNGTGLYPVGSLVQDDNNKLYGLASVGGVSGGKGVVFSYDPASKTQSNLAEFNGINGSNPYGHLTKAANKNYYGTTLDGGVNNLGVIYSFGLATNQLLKIHDFSGINGSKPYGSLVAASNGILYGMTSEGGLYNKGIIFSINPVSNLFTKIHDFDGTNGANPYGSFVEVNSKLFGMTQQGGTVFNYGVII